MSVLLTLRIAVRNLRRSVLRSSLTMLGIVIGVATVIAMLGIGNGAKNRVSSLLSGVDANRLYLYANLPESEWRSARQLRREDGINISDYAAIHAISGVTAVSLEVYTTSSGVFANGRTGLPTVSGTNVEGFAFQRRQLLSGTLFGPEDERDAATVCVITHALAKEFFDASDPIGKIIRVQRVPFLVVGILSDDNSGRGGRSDNRDLTLFLPYTSVLRRLNPRGTIVLGIRATTPALLHDLQQQVGDLMEERRGTRRAQFRISDISEFINSYTSGVETMTLLLASIAGISLFVGGVGIMNVMLVTVTERTREIGIRLAIGSRENDILSQFMLEAMMLSVIGGLLGIGLGIGVTQVMGRYYNWTTHLTTSSILGAFTTSALTGLFFGWYPAKRAARMDPIEALRYE